MVRIVCLLTISGGRGGSAGSGGGEGGGSGAGMSGGGYKGIGTAGGDGGGEGIMQENSMVPRLPQSVTVLGQ